MSAIDGDDHFERFANADAAREQADAWEQRREEQREEAVELYGTALDLFNARYTDTFEVERHGTEIEFYRPVGATDADLSEIEDRELAQRLKRGSDLLERFEDRQRETLLAMQGDDDVDLEALYEDSLDGTALMRQVLSAHAVDESFHDPGVWTAIFRDDDTIGEVFEDFIGEGNPEKKRRKLNALQNLLSESDSDN